MYVCVDRLSITKERKKEVVPLLCQFYLSSADLGESGRLSKRQDKAKKVLIKISSGAMFFFTFLDVLQRTPSLSCEKTHLSGL